MPRLVATSASKHGAMRASAGGETSAHAGWPCCSAQPSSVLRIRRLDIGELRAASAILKRGRVVP